MAWTIYCHTHVESGRCYVGLTSRTWQKRWSQHVTQSRRATHGRQHFLNAIRKYGKEAFEHRILEICETLEVANAAEERWIEKLDTRDPSKGFNLMRGGSHVPHLFSSPWDRPGFRERRGLISKELWKDPSFGRRIQETRKKTASTNESIAKRSAASASLWENDTFREKTSSSIRNRWKDPDYAKKVKVGLSSARAQKPNAERIARIALLEQRSLDCPVHGTMSLEECYVLKARRGKPPTLSCRKCDEERRLLRKSII